MVQRIPKVSAHVVILHLHSTKKMYHHPNQTLPCDDILRFRSSPEIKIHVRPWMAIGNILLVLTVPLPQIACVLEVEEYTRADFRPESGRADQCLDGRVVQDVCWIHGIRIVRRGEDVVCVVWTTQCVYDVGITVMLGDGTVEVRIRTIRVTLLDLGRCESD